MFNSFLSSSPQRGLEARVDNKLHHLRSTVSISSEFHSFLTESFILVLFVSSCCGEFQRTTATGVTIGHVTDLLTGLHLQTTAVVLRARYQSELTAVLSVE